jgi:hypothetical protein
MGTKIIIPYSFFVCKTVGWVDIGHHFESFTVATTTWLTIMTYLCHKWPRKCSTNMGSFNGKNTNPETIWNNFDDIIYNTNPKPKPDPNPSTNPNVHDLVFSKYSTHLYLWFYSIVITLKHGQNYKHASDGRIMLFLCKVGHVCGTESDMFGRV